MTDLIKRKFFNADGTINGKVLSGAIAGLLVFMQAILAIFKIKFTGDLGQIQSAVNAGLSFLAIIGVAENTSEITDDDDSFEDVADADNGKGVA